jgi:hypothetical protein
LTALFDLHPMPLTRPFRDCPFAELVEHVRNEKSKFRMHADIVEWRAWKQEKDEVNSELYKLGYVVVPVKIRTVDERETIQRS